MEQDAPSATVLPVRRDGDPVLHRPCREVTRFGPELEQLVADMVVSMHAAEGVGLAANQVGVDARVFVIDCPTASGERVVGHVVNPELFLPADGLWVEDDEGCLSVPGEHAPVERAYTAMVHGVDVHQQPVSWWADGLAARCFQHEVGHLDGQVYVDLLKARQRRAVLKAAGLAPR
ncbi:peptide deformylase [Angustibacter aerolatus]